MVQLESYFSNLSVVIYLSTSEGCPEIYCAEGDLGNGAGAGNLAFLPLSPDCAILEIESCLYKAGWHGGLLLHASQKLGVMFKTVVLQQLVIIWHDSRYETGFVCTTVRQGRGQIVLDLEVPIGQ